MDKLRDFINEHRLIVDCEFVDKAKGYIDLLLEWEQCII